MTTLLARCRSLLLDDAWLKLLALALAVVTWYYIDAEVRSSAPAVDRRPALAQSTVVF